MPFGNGTSASEIGKGGECVMITLMRRKIDFFWRKLRGEEFGHVVGMSERDERENYSNHVGPTGIKDFFDLEAVIYSKSDLLCFGYVLYKLRNRDYCKICNDSKDTHIIRIVSHRIIPESVRNYIRINQYIPDTLVSFTSGSAHVRRLF